MKIYQVNKTKWFFLKMNDSSEDIYLNRYMSYYKESLMYLSDRFKTKRNEDI